MDFIEVDQAEIPNKEMQTELITKPKQLLIEFCSTLKLDKQILQESIRQNNGRLLIKSIIQRADQKNANGRVYSKQLLEQKLKEYANVFIKENRAYGELDHPETQVVNVKNSCITLERYWWEGNDVWGEFEVLIGTPTGDIVKKILELGKTLGISSRALGSLTESVNGAAMVNQDLEFISFDVVSNPSTYKAQFALNESKQNENLITIVNEMNVITFNKYSKVNDLLHDIICDQTCELAKLNRKK